MHNELILHPQSLSTDNISSYVSWVNKIPMLTLEQEQNLAESLQKNNDLTAARTLVMSHLRLVVKIARGYDGYGLPQADLIQEGNIGLMKAVKRFDPTVGVRLVSFAIHWIRAEIHEFIIRNWRIVKIATTKAQRKLFFNLRRAAKKRGWFSDAEVKTIAQELDVSEKDVRSMEQRLGSQDQSFDAFSDDADEDGSYSFAPAHYIEDNTSNLEHNLVSNNWSNNQEGHLQQALLTLDDRSRDILQERWLVDNKKTLHDLAAKYNVSAERIRQLEKNAMDKLRDAITS